MTNNVQRSFTQAEIANSAVMGYMSKELIAQHCHNEEELARYPFLTLAVSLKNSDSGEVSTFSDTESYIYSIHCWPDDYPELESSYFEETMEDLAKDASSAESVKKTEAYDYALEFLTDKVNEWLAHQSGQYKLVKAEE